NPLPFLVWYSKGEILDETWSNGPQDVVVNQLRFTLNRSHLLSEFVCKAQIDSYLHRKSVSLIVDMNLKPLDVRIIAPKSKLIAHKKVELQCISYGSKPVVTITWFLGKQKLLGSSDSSSEDGNFTRSSISFIPSPEDNRKHIICKAENMNFDQNAIRAELLLDIFYVPQLKVALGASIKPDSIRQGIDVFLECDVRANPPIQEMTWTFDEKQLISNLSDGVLVANHSLVLQKVKKHHRGYYRCVARNDVGVTATDPFFLRVQFAPVCKANQKLTYGSSKDELVVINCEVESDPRNVSFKWLMNSSNTIVDINTFTTNGSKSYARYTPRSRFGFGSILCFAENSVGKQIHPCVFNIVPAGPPEKVENCSLTNQTMSSLLLECTPGDSNGLQQAFFADLYDSENELVYNVSNELRPSFVFENLTSGSSYIVFVYAVNAKGKSQSVRKKVSTYVLTKNEMKQGLDEEHKEQMFNPLISILIAFVAILVVIVIVMIVVVRIRVDGRRGDESVYASDANDAKSDTRGQEKSDVYQIYKNMTNCDVSCLQRNNEPFEMKEHIFFVTEDSGTIAKCGNPYNRSPIATTTAIKNLESQRDNNSLLMEIAASVDERQPRISLIPDKCGQLLPNRESLRVDGCSESETPVETPLMKNIRISCDGSEVTISFKLPKEPTTPEAIISRTTPTELTFAVKNKTGTHFSTKEKRAFLCSH
ncbi:Nephrin-like protein, partial [Leptotrombidium deliense]